MTTLIIALISSTLFFLLGVMIGREYAIREGMVTVRGSMEKQTSSVPPGPEGREGHRGHPGKDQEKVDITFYDQLMKEGDQELNHQIAKNEEDREKSSRPAAEKREKEKTKPRPEKQEPPRPKKAGGSRTGDYALQVAAFRDRGHALQMVRVLKRQGFNAHLLKGALPGGGGTFYRVWVGYYRTLPDAVHARAMLRRQHAIKIPKALIIKR